MVDSVEVFEKFAKEYDAWFDKNKLAYESELLALRRLIPEKGRGIEIGVGTGRFAIPLGIKEGVEPSDSMAKIAKMRGVRVYKGTAENLPLSSSSFDFATMITTLCFVRDPIKAIKEAKRILREKGLIIIGMIDKESPLGRIYEKKKKKSKFYRHANFYSVSEVVYWLKKLNFMNFKFYQTIFTLPEKMKKVEPPKEGYGEGGFVAISGQRNF